MPVIFYSMFFLFLVQCSRQTAVIDPVVVNPKEVKSVLSTDSPEQKEVCRTELASQKSSVLYENDLGLLFIDKASEDLKLDKCQAKISANETLPMRSPTKEEGEQRSSDLSTLLRLIPAEEIGARSFVKDNPSFDGRNVIVGILDTGIELDHPMLKSTPSGEDKIIDFNDMSGEGRVELVEVKKDAEGIIKGPEGGAFQVKSIKSDTLKLGIFHASTLVQAEALSQTDQFTDLAVVVYSTGQRQWTARIDTNNDRNFDDEIEVSNFNRSHKFLKIGQNRSLTVSVNIAANGQSMILCFDDGSHGTHVAGIATGYDPAGLQGVAPGAKVVAVKIGDNRLSGGSTTTASMLLAIDYAVSQKVDVINLSYGIRAGSNLGTSTIDQYIDKVARAKNILFSISAGNEGPGLLTIGTPAGANLAITNAAFVSKKTAQDNYGYMGVEGDNTWFFSSVGPLLDGGWKPTLLAPGSALSSVPLWDKKFANYRGTSMASPQVTGGLALLLSAAKQSSLSTDRASITKAVYGSAKPISTLLLIEQGHGLMNIPSALALLKTQNREDAKIEYSILVKNPALPNGLGKGIFLKSAQTSSRVFDVSVTPRGAKEGDLRTFKLIPSEKWISTPESVWMNGATKGFQVKIEDEVFKKPGIFSAKVTAVDEKTAEPAFDIPVTVINPRVMDGSNSYAISENSVLKVGKTLRSFIQVPAGTTSIELNLKTDGPLVWGQLLDSEGRNVVDCRSSETGIPMSPLHCVASVEKSGLYEIDWVAPASNPRAAKIEYSVNTYSLMIRLEGAKANGDLNLSIENNIGVVRVVPKVSVKSYFKQSTVEIKGNSTRYPFLLTEQDTKDYSKILFTVQTSKEYYDAMTDYPYRVFDKDGNIVASGGLELNSQIEVKSLEEKKGECALDIQGAFTNAAPAAWAVRVREERVLNTPLELYSGKAIVLEMGGSSTFTVPSGTKKDLPYCLSVSLENGSRLVVQESVVCL